MDSLNFTLLGEVLTFIVLVYVTMKYVWPPVIKTITERQKKIADGLMDAERGAHSLELARQGAAKILQKAKNEAAGIVEKAQWRANEMIEHGKVKAQEEGNVIIKLALSDIEKEKIAAREELQRKAAALALLIAEKLIRSNVKDKEIYQRLVDKAISNLSEI
jgi:F-type H+-transporting ATPase subunit b